MDEGVKLMTKHKTMPQFPEPYWRDSVEFSRYPKLDESVEADEIGRAHV